MSVSRSAKLLLAGATGLVGGLALAALLEADRRRHWQIYTPTRRALSLTHPRLHPIEVDPGTPAGQAQCWSRRGYVWIALSAPSAAP